MTLRAAMVCILGREVRVRWEAQVGEERLLGLLLGAEATGFCFDGLQKLIVVIAVSSERLLFQHLHIRPRKQASPNSVRFNPLALGTAFDVCRSVESKRFCGSGAEI